MPTKIKDIRTQFDDGSFVEVVAYDVPNSDEYPDGYKYRFQYGTTEGTVLRYDNSHGDHDRHFGNVDEKIRFDGLEEHLERFFGEVEGLREEGIVTPEEAEEK